jgi:predicted transcriptional regulator
MPKKTISFNIDEADLARLDGYAANLERDRTFVLNEAVKMYIADAEREAAEDEEAMRGPFYSPEEVSVEIDRVIAAADAIRKQLDREEQEQTQLTERKSA